MLPDNEDLSTANLLNSDDLYSVKGAVLGLSTVVILVALVFGCQACDRKRRYRHKRRRRMDRSLDESKDSNSSNGQSQAQPIFLDATSPTNPFQSPGPPSQSGTYGAIVQSGPYVMGMPSMNNLGPASYAPSAPYVPVMTSTTFPAAVPASQHKQQLPLAQPEDLPPAYHTVFPEKKS